MSSAEYWKWVDAGLIPKSKHGASGGMAGWAEEHSKFGKNDYFFAVGEIKETTLDSIRSFSSQAFDYSGQHRVNKLPPGLFGGYWVFPIILVDQIENSVMNAVQQEDPPKHYSSAEFPIVIEKTTKKVYYFQRTPTWGAAFYAGFRQLASEIASL